MIAAAESRRPGGKLKWGVGIAVAALMCGMLAGSSPGLGLAAVGGLAYVLLATASFDGALAVLLVSWAAIPIYIGIDPGGGMPVVNIQRAMGAILIIVWCARRLVNRQRLFPRTALDRPVGLLVLVMVAVLPFAALPTKAAMKIASDLIEQVLYFYLAYEVVRRRGAWWLFGIIAGSGLIVVILGFFQAGFGFDPFAAFGTVRDYVGTGPMERRMGLPRIYGPFTHPIVFGMFFAQVVPIVLALAARSRGMRRKGWFAAVGSCVMSSALSLSRGPWFATFVVLMAASRRRIRRAIVPLAILSAALIAQPWALQDQVRPFRRIITASFEEGSAINGSAMARVFQLYYTAAEVAKRPLTGYGPRGETVVADSWLGQGIGLDSYPLEMALDSGLLRVAFFYWCFFAALRLFRRRRDQLAEGDALALDACLWSVVAANLVLLTLAGSSTLYLYWSMLGAGVALCADPAPAGHGERIG